MPNIFVNGVNAKSGGGSSILKNYIELLHRETKNNNKFYVLTPNRGDYVQYENENVTILDVPSYYSKTLLAPLVYGWLIERLIKRYKCKVVFNLGDLIVRTKARQVYLFDWSYAVYPDHEVWSDMGFSSWFIRRSKLFFIRRNIGAVAKVIAQTPVIKGLLEAEYNLDNVCVIPNAVSLTNYEESEDVEWGLPSGKRLLYLTCYYPHKNLEVFLPLAVRIKKEKLDLKIIVTIDRGQHKSAGEFLDKIVEMNLDDVIVNIGPVAFESVPSLYRACNALLMPTLLESFSGTYVEAMHHRIPIFTSDYDFAKGICKDAAFYFDARNSDSIYESLVGAFFEKGAIEEKILNGDAILEGMLGWQDTFPLYNNLIDEMIEC